MDFGMDSMSTHMPDFRLVKNLIHCPSTSYKINSFPPTPPHFACTYWP